MIWKVRAIPRAESGGAGSPTMERSRKRIPPRVGARNPEIIAKPWSSGPVRTDERDDLARGHVGESRTAWAKRFEPRTASESTPSTRATGQARRRTGSPGEEQHDHDEQDTVDDQVGAVPAALAEVVARDLAERRQDEGAEHRAQRGSGAAHDGPDDDLHGERDAEEGVRLEREEVEGVEGPEPREERREDHGAELVAEPSTPSASAALSSSRTAVR